MSTDSARDAQWPEPDPATVRTLPPSSTPLDPARVEQLLAGEWERFSAQTEGSAAHHARALVPLPLGVASSFQHWDPHPVAIVSAKGAWLNDVDGRQLLDLSMGFGSMLVGHLNPVVVEKVTEARVAMMLAVMPSLQALEDEELAAENAYVMAQAVVDSFAKKKDLVVSLAGLARAEIETVRATR